MTEILSLNDWRVAPIWAGMDNQQQSRSAPEPLAVSMAEAARRLGVSRTFLYEEVGRGRLPTIKLAKRRLVAVADLGNYLCAHREMPKAA